MTSAKVLTVMKVMNISAIQVPSVVFQLFIPHAAKPRPQYLNPPLSLIARCSTHA